MMMIFFLALSPCFVLLKNAFRLDIAVVVDRVLIKPSSSLLSSLLRHFPCSVIFVHELSF